MQTVTIIDTFGFLFRSYFALPPLSNKDGFPTGLLTGFANFISNIYSEHLTDYLVFALDSEGKSFRNDIDENYKAHRPDVPQDLLKQLPVAISWIDKIGFASKAVPGFEADDIVATLAKKAKKAGYKVRIVSHDKDLYQLISDNIHMYDPIKKKEIGPDECMEKYGIRPDQFVDYQAMVGDSADNVPGIKGIGAKTAQKLLTQFGSLENIYKNIDIAGTPRIKKLLHEGKDAAFISKQLVTLRDDVDVDFDSKTFDLVEKPLVKIKDELERYELRRVLGKVGSHSKTNAHHNSYEFEALLLDTSAKLEAVIDKLGSNDIVAFDTETDSLNATQANLVGFSFCTQKSKAYYVPIAHKGLDVGNQLDLQDALKGIKKLFGCKIVGQNIKYDLKVLHKYGQNLPAPFCDTMILSWLHNPGLKHGLDIQAKRFFDYTMKPFKELVAKGQTFADVALGKACFYAAEDAWMTYLLYDKYKNILDDKFFTIAGTIEIPFIRVLLAMELEGIAVDRQKLHHLGEVTQKRLQELTTTIYELSGTEFNINSTQQLASVLFERLGLQGGKKTKTGFSTNEKVLQTLIDKHPVIEKILQYREVQKISSTYVKPLERYLVDGRIYTNFMHTGTATGRLSSNNPNLQNIPTRSDLGKKVRDCFVAKEGYSLVSIDYSQIELRLLAHFSRDKALIEAFNNDEDIHLATARKLFGDRAKEKRNFAKSVNFGLLYGMGSRKLGEELGIPAKEAKQIIQDYFASFASVKTYLNSIEQKAQEDGYVTTIAGRRRYFDFASANAMMQNAYLREAVNTVFQGSAADLIKKGMNKIFDNFHDNPDVRMLLQIHDELIFEIKSGKEEEYGKRLQTILQEVYSLKVPLKTSLDIAKSWGELK